MPAISRTTLDGRRARAARAALVAIVREIRAYRAFIHEMSSLPNTETPEVWASIPVPSTLAMSHVRAWPKEISWPFRHFP